MRIAFSQSLLLAPGSRWRALVVVLALTHGTATRGVAAQRWDAEAVVELLKAREEAIQSLDVVLKLTEGYPAELDAYHDAKRASDAAFAALRQQSVGAAEPRGERPLPSAMMHHYMYDSRRRMRIEDLLEEGAVRKVLRAAVFDGSRWFTGSYGPQRGGAVDAAEFGASVPFFGRIPGVELSWRSNGAQVSTVRSLYQNCQEARRNNGLVVLGEETDKTGRRLVKVRLQRHTSHPNAVERSLYDTMTLWLDPALGMAPVRSRQQDVTIWPERTVERAVAFVDTEWSGHREVLPGVWLAGKCRQLNFLRVTLPKSGTSFAPELRAALDDRDDRRRIALYDRLSRDEVFNVAYVDGEVLEMKVNEPLERGTFKLEYEDGTLVGDHTTGKLFMVGEASPEVEAALRSSVNYERRSAWRSPRRMIAVVCGVGAILLAGVTVWRRVAMKRRR
ncbi:MAG TPA: hypothetical protein VND64_21755 [Pirellulales bacterium]|nr:hypothetical protein [Pirellulales bacterium]